MRNNISNFEGNKNNENTISSTLDNGERGVAKRNLIRTPPMGWILRMIRLKQKNIEKLEKMKNQLSSTAKQNKKRYLSRGKIPLMRVIG